MDTQTGRNAAETASGERSNQLRITQNDHGPEPTRPTRLIDESLNFVPHDRGPTMGFIDDEQPAPSVDIVVVKDRV